MPAAISPTMMAATTQSTIMQNGGAVSRVVEPLDHVVVASVDAATTELHGGRELSAGRPLVRHHGVTEHALTLVEPLVRASDSGGDLLEDSRLAREADAPIGSQLP